MASVLNRLAKSIKRIRQNLILTPAAFHEDVHGIKRRKYSSYNQYLLHQARKLGKKKNRIVRHDIEFEEVLVDRLPGYNIDYRGKSALCLAARLGAEVRALKRLGAFAVGVDLEPGDDNQHVLRGDFHDLKFADSTVDIIYFNSVDHAFDLQRVVEEIARVLKMGGTLILEIARVEPGRYEAIDTSSPKEIIRRFETRFQVDRHREVRTRTSYVDYASDAFICIK